MAVSSIPRQTLMRLPVYLSYLKGLGAQAPANISSAAIAAALNLGPVQVRKDLACLPCTGRPKTGYVTTELIRALEHFLGYDDTANAIVVGAGKLGRSLMSYSGFAHYGLNILAAFDTDPCRYTVRRQAYSGYGQAGRPVQQAGRTHRHHHCPGRSCAVCLRPDGSGWNPGDLEFCARPAFSARRRSDSQ